MGDTAFESDPARDCCGKPQGCTNESPECRYRQHPYKRWARGEIALHAVPRCEGEHDRKLRGRFA